MKYIQSFYQYPVTFSSIGKAIPARDADGELRNLAEFTDREVEILQHSEPLFRELIKSKKIRVLNHMPESYKPAATQINEAHSQAAAAQEENEKLRARIAELEAAAANGTAPAAQEPAEAKDEEAAEEVDLEKLSYKELQEKAKEKGLNYKNVNKAKLIESIKAAK